MLQTLKLLLPALFPSWRFFDAIAPSPRVEICLLQTKQDTPRPWAEFRPRPTYLPISHMIKRMFWNPRWNESLFLVSCCERFVETEAEIHSREILSRISADLQKQNAATAPFLQFRLVYVSRVGAEIQKEILYTSPIHSLTGTSSP